MHHHNHSYPGTDHHRDFSGNRDLRNLGIVLILNTSFTAIEIIGGFLTNSVAILADAIHDAGDSIAIGIAWYFQSLAKRGSNARFSYGYKRFSVLGALINSTVLLIGSAFILSETIPRLMTPEDCSAPGMLALAVVGIAANGSAFLILRSGKSINERVVSLHLLEDALGWIAVLVGSALIWMFGWTIIDPVLAILITIYILVGVTKNLRKVIRIIMQATPSETVVEQLHRYFSSLQTIRSYHDLHLWTLDGTYHILSVHLVFKSDQTADDIIGVKQSVKQDLGRFNIAHPTLEIEFEHEFCSLKDQ